MEAGKRKFLIVDDEPDILKLTSLRLKKLGYDIIRAIDGKEAFDVIKNNRPDLVLLDLVIPVIGGDEVCMKIKANERLKHVPIVLFTASSDAMTAEKARDWGLTIT